MRIALIGFLSAYEDGLALLSRAIEELTSAFSRVTLIYIGPVGQLKYIPASLTNITQYAGFLDDEARDEAMAGCQVAYLPGPLRPPEVDLRSKHSIPSRTADYMAVGLPVVAAANAHSATVRFFSPLGDRGFFPVASPEDFRRAIIKLTNKAFWLNAVRECTSFYEAHFNSVNALHELRSLVDRFA